MQIAYRRDLSNIALQETRLRRHRQLDTEKLQVVQKARKEAEKPSKNMYHAKNLYKTATRSGNTFVPELFGFEFSVADIQHHIDLETFKDNMTGRDRTLSPQEYEKAFARFCPGKTAKAA